MSEEYREHFGEHAYDEQGNYIGPAVAADDADREAAWAEYYNEYGGNPADNSAPPEEGSAGAAVADVTDDATE
ncbi:MAG TPA: hypothetical protein VK461_16560 [Acidimicrobiales bacterium]|nr:hypothetical protein [Acidimicrobiales bacterium]